MALLAYSVKDARCRGGGQDQPEWRLKRCPGLDAERLSVVGPLTKRQLVS